MKGRLRANLRRLLWGRGQTRPGQSGSIVFNMRTGAIVGLLIGAYAPNSGVIIAGINPHELKQTSYCISANHIKEML